MRQERSVWVGIVLFTLIFNFAAPAFCAGEYVEGEALVVFKSSATRETSSNVLAAHSVKMAKRFEHLSRWKNREMGLVRGAGKTTNLVAELRKNPDVEFAEPNYIRKVSSWQPNDSYFSYLWGYQNTGQSILGVAGTSGADIKFLKAWNLARPSTNTVVVAVIDTGVDYAHPDLVGNIWTNTAEIAGNGVDDDGNGYIDDTHGWDFADNTNDPMDSGYHGTHVAGIIAAAGNNALGVIGVDFNAKILPLKASSDGEYLDASSIIEAVQYATLMKNRGVNIVAINASFTGADYSYLEAQAIQAAGDAGIVYCAAAGNYTNNNDVTPAYPASYRLANMIVVAASDQNDGLASFSSYGAQSVDLAAPGVDILSSFAEAQAGSLATVTASNVTYSALELEYSGRTAAGSPVGGDIIDCGVGYSANFPAAVKGNIALISRGTLNFSAKVLNAMNAGAAAAVIYNNASGNFSGTLGSSGQWIPAVSISQADGLAIKAALPLRGSVANAADPSAIYQYLSGTSMATPMVSGAVAFAAINFPNETVTQRVHRIVSSVDAVASLSGRVASGGRLNLQKVVDTDLNGLPDWWEQAHFGVSSGTDPNGDPDHDGANNLAEWLAGTDPTNPRSCLSLNATLTAQGALIAWPSVSGKYYRVDRAYALGSFAPIATNILATAPLNQILDSATRSNAAFYRVVLEP